jgi:hypothetical protein
MTRENHDLRPLLGAWKYDAANTVRRVSLGGREVLQVRLPLGLEQYEVDGRPDGLRPMRRESWLHHYQRKARLLGQERKAFRLRDEDIARLHQEGLLYYYRYILFFQIQEYRLSARDTYRNLKLLDFVAQHASPEQALDLEQYRPYILRMHVTSKALQRIQSSGDVRGALRLLRQGVRQVEGIEPAAPSEVLALERTRSLESLRDLIDQLSGQLPVPRRVALQREMDRAVREENYEKAAVLRDEIARMARRAEKKQTLND